MATSLEKFRDIFEKKAFCHIATVGRDGRPQVTPVWCDFDGRTSASTPRAAA